MLHCDQLCKLQVDSAPYKVVEFLHVKPGKGAAFVRTKLKNYLTGNSVEKTFRAGEVVQTADVQKKDGQFTYMDGDEYVFMDTESYEETRLKRDEWANFLKEGSTCQLMFYNGKVISVAPPQFVDLKVRRQHAVCCGPTFFPFVPALHARAASGTPHRAATRPGSAGAVLSLNTRC